jgi:Protein of unknown function (DUF2934)
MLLQGQTIRAGWRLSLPGGFMEVTPRSSPKAAVKRATPKPKVPPAAVARKPAARKATMAAAAGPTDAELNSMIAEAAYLLAAARGFAQGHELEDWLAAEKQVLARYR